MADEIIKDNYKGNTIILRDGRDGMIFGITANEFYVSLGKGEKAVVKKEDVTWHGSEGYET